MVIISFFLNGCNQENSVNYDVCVYGGTSSGVIAAYSAKMMGERVILVEPGGHLGGMTSGGLGETDIGNKYAINGLSREFYRKIGKHYHTFEQWTFEPHVAEGIFTEMIDRSGVVLWLHSRITRAKKNGTEIKLIHIDKQTDGRIEKWAIHATVFIDCSYEGDLMARSGVTYEVGREGNQQYGEHYNGVELRELNQFPDGVDPYVIKGDPSSGLLWGISPEKRQPDGSADKKVQAYNIRLCLTDSAENRLPVDKPADYDSSHYELLLRVIENSGSHDLWNYLSLGVMPDHKTDINNNGGFSTDMIGMNWDYPEGSYELRNKIFREHESYTRGLLYFLGHDRRIPGEMREEMLRWGYPKDEYPDHDHFTWQLYIREARRMVGEYVMTEHNCTGERKVDDPAGMAAYTMDSHNIERLVVNGMVKNEGDVQIGGFLPYQISYRSLVPRKDECTNLLVPVCLSASHIAYGSIRMEPVFMVLGQTAGVAAVLAIQSQSSIQSVDNKALNDTLSADPLLDGTPPEILVDNGDSSQVSFAGNWRVIPGSWTNKAYFMDYALCQNGKGTAEYKFIPIKSGMAEIYFYCPDPAGEKGLKSGFGDIPFVIKKDNRVIAGGTVPGKEYAGKWYPAAGIELEARHPVSFVAGSHKISTGYATDAILAVYNPVP